MKRDGCPNGIARAALSLAGGESRYGTGAEIAVDGGDATCRGVRPLITIVAPMACAPGPQAEIRDIFRWFVSATRAEPGCIDVHTQGERDGSTRFVQTAGGWA